MLPPEMTRSELAPRIGVRNTTVSSLQISVWGKPGVITCSGCTNTGCTGCTNTVLWFCCGELEHHGPFSRFDFRDPNTVFWPQVLRKLAATAFRGVRSAAGPDWSGLRALESFTSRRVLVVQRWQHIHGSQHATFLSRTSSRLCTRRGLLHVHAQDPRGTARTHSLTGWLGLGFAIASARDAGRKSGEAIKEFSPSIAHTGCSCLPS